MTAPLRWRSQLCPCGYCPDGTRIEWRYSLDIRFRPRRKLPERIVSNGPQKLEFQYVRAPPRAHARNVRKALAAPPTEEREEGRDP